MDEVELKTAAGLRSSAPFSQSAPVPSRKCLSAAAMLPKRVGLPSARPSHSIRSSCVAKGGPDSGTAASVASVVGETGGTVRNRAVTPATDSMPRTMWRASSAVVPCLE
jgi:hypothetical protein